MSDLPPLVVIFRAHSDVEASVIRGLLEAHDIPTVSSSEVSRSLFPLTVTPLTVSVSEADAADALRIIESHRTEFPSGRVVRLRDEFGDLQRAIAYRFKDIGLLEHALTHTSKANEDVSGGVRDNESLEFLGDAVLGFVVADLLFREFPQSDEGEKSKMKASLVSTQALARQADLLSLGDHLLLGKGEEKTGGRRKQALLADAYEALIAAVYLDGGIDEAAAFVLRELGPRVADLKRDGPGAQDYKSALQEHLQSREYPLPEYRLTGALGPDHRKVFEVELLVNGESLAKGSGASKKEAEQEAARLALEQLKT
jgi:ribonuclease-3